MLSNRLWGSKQRNKRYRESVSLRFLSPNELYSRASGIGCPRAGPVHYWTTSPFVPNAAVGHKARGLYKGHGSPWAGKSSESWVCDVWHLYVPNFGSNCSRERFVSLEAAWELSCCLYESEWQDSFTCILPPGKILSLAAKYLFAFLLYWNLPPGCSGLRWPRLAKARGSIENNSTQTSVIRKTSPVIATLTLN